MMTDTRGLVDRLRSAGFLISSPVGVQASPGDTTIGELLKEAADKIVALENPDAGPECPFRNARAGTHSGVVARRQLNTRYVDEKSNWVTCCEDCYRDIWDQYRSMWCDSGQGDPYGDCPIK